jgi:hypothetical protein
LKNAHVSLFFRKAKITFAITVGSLTKKLIERSAGEGTTSKFKAEVFLLLMAIALFAASAPVFGYTNEPVNATLAFSASLIYPYRGLAIALVGFGLFMMITATFLYRKRIKKSVCQARFPL